MREQKSILELVQYMEGVEVVLRGEGRELNESEAQVLRKLRTRTPGTAVRRVWMSTSEGFSLWDLLTEQEIAQRGYQETTTQPRGVGSGFLSAARDTISYWTSNTDREHELWVGLRMLD